MIVLLSFLLAIPFMVINYADVKEYKFVHGKCWNEMNSFVFVM